MRLKTYNYSQFGGTSRQWTLSGLELGPINLVVGKNASGKTRTLNTINGLGRLVSGRKRPSELSTGTHTATFEHQGRTLRYHLEIQNNKVAVEEFNDEGRVLLKRGAGGKGVIFHEKQGEDQEFQTPEEDAAVFARRDSIQHKFLEPLGEWGEGVRHYAFGDKMGQPTITLIVPDGPAPDPRDVNAIVALFRKGNNNFPGTFADAVREDMNSIGYDIAGVDVSAPTDLTLTMPIGGKIEPLILSVQEQDLACVTQQNEMSQGMFRALSVLILVNYAVIASRPSCIIVDDIGEGLDFERSCKLINVLRTKATQSQVQLILSTNDRFVMNEVPLNEWSILQRNGSCVQVRNYANSRKHFDTFKYMGLNNFDFLRYDFLSEDPDLVLEGAGSN